MFVSEHIIFPVFKRRGCEGEPWFFPYAMQA